MDKQIVNSLLLLIAGGLLTILGAWLNDIRSERRRVRAKLEEAYLAWLNNEVSLISRLKELSRLAKSEPKSLQEHDQLIERATQLHSDLQALTSALNFAVVYERNKKKRILLEKQSGIYSDLVDSLDIIIRHHKTHLDIRDLVGKMDALLLRIDAMKKTEGAQKKEDVLESLSQFEASVMKNREEAYEHLSKCGSSLGEDAGDISRYVKELEKEASELRNLLVR